MIFHSQTHSAQSEHTSAHVDSLQLLLPHSCHCDRLIFWFAKKIAKSQRTNTGADLKCKRQFRVGFFPLRCAIILREIVNCQSEPEWWWWCYICWEGFGEAHVTNVSDTRGEREERRRKNWIVKSESLRKWEIFHFKLLSQELLKCLKCLSCTFDFSIERAKNWIRHDRHTTPLAHGGEQNFF